MKKTLMAATHNKKKLEELKRIFAQKGIEIVAPDDKELLNSIVEDGETFEENALIKAKAVFNAYKIPTIADDSGLCIDALEGKPGVYSARFLGEDTPYTTKNQMVLDMLKAVAKEDRTARFSCAIAIVTADSQQVFRADCPGEIGYVPAGEGGFGYDPIFYVGDKSYAQLTAEEKDLISHRGKAIEVLLKEIDSFI